MAIDGIGKPPTPPAVGPTSAAGVDALKTEPFTVSPSTATTAAAPLSPALEGLSRGELSLEQYLDQRVELAVGHLTGKLAATELAFVKQSLRDQLETDPVLVELVRRTTAGLSAKPA